MRRDSVGKMKTLDEVIKAWTICFSDNSRSNCTGCPYADEDGEAACFNHDREDAFHYLKEYRSKEMFYNQSIDHLLMMINEHEDRVCAYLAEMRKNDPLIWSELKQMEGKPVWVEEKYSFSDEWHGQWEVIRGVWENEFDDDPYLWMTDDEYRHKDTLGEIWQAYRKERE